MRPEHEHNPQMTGAVEDLKRRLQERFPDATFAVSPGQDPDGLYLSPIVDVEDTDEVLDVVLDRLLEIQVDDGLPLYVVPLLPLERVAEQLKREKKRTLPPV